MRAAGSEQTGDLGRAINERFGRSDLPPTRIGTDPDELTPRTHDSTELDTAPRLDPVTADLCLPSRRLVGAALDDDKK